MKIKRFFRGILLGALAVGVYYGVMFALSFASSIVISMFMYAKNPEVNISEIQDVYESLSTTVYLIAGILVIFIIWLFFKLTKKDLATYCDIRKVPAALLFVPYFLGYAFNVITVVLVDVFPIPKEWLEKHAESTDFKGPEIIIILTVMILAPILEEIVFRGLLYRTLKNHSSVWFATIVSAVVFGAIHGNKLQAIYAGALGLVLVFTYEMSGSLHSSMALHVGFNSAGIVQYITGIYNWPPIAQFILAVILIIILLYILVSIKKQRDNFTEMYLQ